MTIFKKTSAHLFRYISAPVLLSIFFGLVLAAYYYYDLPSREDVVRSVEELVVDYGSPILFLVALAEGVVFVNWYLPGSAIILLGYVFAANNHEGMISVVFSVSLGLLIAQFINYEIGRRGWYQKFVKAGAGAPLRAMEYRVGLHGLKFVFLTHFYPSIGSLASASAGTLKKSKIYLGLISFLGILFWNSLWMAGAYWLGRYVIDILEAPAVVFVLLAWMLWGTLVFLKKEKQEKRGLEEVNKIG